MYNIATIQDRLDRVAYYFPDQDLRRVITGGVSEKPARAVTREDVHAGLEEGTWGHRVLNVMTNNDTNSNLLSRYIEAVKNIQKREPFWQVDAEGNTWAPLWVRLLDRLKFYAEANPLFKGKLSPAAYERIDGVYKEFQKAIDERRAKHTAFDTEFTTIFSGAQYDETRRLILQPLTGEVTPKHCGLFLFEIEDHAVRMRAVQSYFQALTSHHDVPLAAKLVDWYGKNLDGYSKDHDDRLPEDLVTLSHACIRVFEQEHASSDLQKLKVEKIA